MVNDVKFVRTLQEHRLSLAPQLKIPTKEIINLTAAKNALFIYLHAINALIFWANGRQIPSAVE